MKLLRNFFLCFLCWFLIAGVAYYLFLPALNPHSIGFYLYVSIFCLLPAALLFLLSHIFSKSEKVKNISGKLSIAGFLLCVLIILFLLLAGWFNSSMFHAKKYASILPVTDFDFTEDIDEANALGKIALMDTDSARILGSRKIGSLSEVVSQFEVSEDYSQIDLNNAPAKVSALEYAGFFKYLANKSDGIPGYVKVDPVAQNADYITLNQGMIYVPSAYFQKDLMRHLRFLYPTKIFDYPHFEIDEEGMPFYIAPVIDYTVGLFGGETISGAVICNPVTGDCTYYDVDEIPSWADIIFNGDLLTQQYNWYGTLSGGFFNSIMAKKGCKTCTETTIDDNDDTLTINDYGYISKDGDIWIYTGVTSVNDDSSNIGFIMINERTAEAHYFSIAGADENSAMASAQGEVQEKGYTASFPSLINVDGQPTYVMVLKDSNGIVKLYAMVNVEQYNIVATAESLDSCFASYRRKLGGTGSGGDDLGTDSGTDSASDSEDGLGVDSASGLVNGSGADSSSSSTLTAGEPSSIPDYTQDDIKTRSFSIKNIQYVEINGNTYVYLTGNDDAIYKQRFADNEKLILLNLGDSVTAECVETEEGIFYIISIK
jgi:hypothetical protein